MRFGFVASSGVVLCLLGACSPEYEKKVVHDGTGAAGGQAAGGTSGSGSGGASSASGSRGGTGSSGKSNGSGSKNGSGSSGSGASDGGGVPGGAVPILNSLSAHVTGRAGADVTITAEGEDADKDTLFLSLQWQDAEGNAIVAFDTDWNGVPDTDKARVFFDQNLSGKDSFTATINVPAFLLDHPQAKALVGHLEDAAGQQSDEQTAEIVGQDTKSSGEACDLAVVENRCDSGLGCMGDPPVCKKADAPTTDKLAYVRGAEGPLLLVTGTDAADDITTLNLEFLSKTNAPIPIDFNGDQVPDSATFDLPVSGTSRNGAYFVKDYLGFGIDKTVPRIAVTPMDAKGQKGTRKLTDIADAPTRATGQTCDPRGFNACAAACTCAESTDPDVSVCITAATLRLDSCKAGAGLDPDKGALSAFGRAEGPSLWDPPSGCAQASAIIRPEGVVRLHLGSGAARLTVSSAIAETAFDTVLYVLPACDAKGSDALACNDDTDGFSSTVVLTDVPAGDYIVVVDSTDETGGGFGVSIIVE